MSAGVVRERRAELGAYLREHRCARGFSIREAAKRLGHSVAWLSRLENAGPARLDSSAQLQAFADLYGIPVAEVLDRAGFRVEPEELEAAAKAPRGLRSQRAVCVPANRESADAINALIGEGWRVTSVVRVGTELLVLVEAAWLHA